MIHICQNGMFNNQLPYIINYHKKEEKKRKLRRRKRRESCTPENVLLNQIVANKMETKTTGRNCNSC